MTEGVHALAEQAEAARWPALVVSTLRGRSESPGPARVILVPDGPYLVTGPVAITDHLGCAVEHGAMTVLCRCGESASKPNCDAACIRIGFDDAKSPDRVPDRRDAYVGEQVTVFDNRGICQHSGYCTTRLPSVFHETSDPFVTPGGGRMDEIIRAARDCPSGALAYAIDGEEQRAQTDWGGTRPPTILISKDGPYRLSGAIEVLDASVEPVDRAHGSSREHAALCRCGHSQNKPFCSGMHWYVDFHDPVPDPDAVPTVFAWAGGFPALLRLTRIFYEKYIPNDDLLAPLFATMAADHPQRVAAWLGEVFGGPKAYSGTYGGYERMLSQHIGKGIDEARRSRWVQLLTASANEAGLPNDPEFRSVFGSYIEWGSRLAVENSTPDATPPPHMPMPSWDWHTAAGPPGSRVSALDHSTQPEPDEPVVLPGEDEPVSYTQHIKALFRDRDRRSMSFAFDLWSYQDVSANAEPILERLQAGSMPCDGAWPPERVAVFARWLQQGTAP